MGQRSTAGQRPYALAVVGTGAIAGLHADAVVRSGGRARLVSAVDIDPQRLADFADRWSVPDRFPDVTTMLEAGRPDLVVLCTPPNLHKVQAVAFLTRDVTVWCEKPPALSLAEIDEISMTAQRSKGHFATVLQHRFGGGAVRLRGLIGDARLGRPLAAVCHTLWHRPDEYFRAPWRGQWQVEGGGPTMGLGIHQMDLLCSILGPWREVVAVAARQARPTDTEDLSCAVISFANGAVASVVNSAVSTRQTSYLRFDFEHATVELTHLYGYDDSDWVITPAPGREAQVAAAWTTAPTSGPSGHGAQLRAVLDALDAGAEPPVTLTETRTTMELVAAIYASAFGGGAVACGQISPDSPFYHRMDGAAAPWPALDRARL